MKRIAVGIALSLIAFAAIAGQMTLLGAGKAGGGGGGSYVGPKDAVSKTALMWGSCARGYALASVGANACEICNALDAACTVVTVGANGKVTIPTVGGTNCATPGACTIRTIYDQSGANACSGGACNIVTANITDRPILSVNALNSLACIVSTPGSTSIPAVTFSGIAQPYTMSAVAINNVSSPGGILGDGGAVGFFDNGTNWGFFASSNFSDGASDATTYHAFQFTAASTPRIVVDASTTTGTTNQAGTAAFGASLRFAADAYSRWSGTICELGLWNGFSTGDDSNMNANQHSSAYGYNF